MIEQPATSIGTAIEIQQGLVGLPEHKRFRLVTGKRAGFYWLQSQDDPDLGFVLVDPFPLFSEYSIDIGAADQLEVGPFERSELLVLTVVTVRDGDVPVTTANLRGPIVFNLRTGLAKQMVLPDLNVDLRASFDPLPAVSAAV